MRILTNEDVKKYFPMIEKCLKDYVIKNWRGSSLGKDKGDMPLGTSGYTMNDMRQHLRTEVCVALQNYNPDFRTEEGLSVKESTFVCGHLFKRIGQLMKKLTRKGYGYGVWHANIEEVLWETDKDE